MTAVGCLLVFLAVFFMVLTVRAVQFRPLETDSPQPMLIAVEEDAAAKRLQAMIRLRTISDLDDTQVDQQAFADFRALLPSLYPKVHEVCSREMIGAHGMLYIWKGSSSDEPSVFMSHYDVVPVNEADWEEPPFSGNIKNGELWGRGTLDTKGTLHGILEAAEILLAQGFTPKNDIYFAFGGDEEIMGKDAPAIVETLKSRGITPAFVLDEGGAVVDGVFPGVKRSAAMVGIAEKGSVFMDITATGKGGHASAPPTQQSLLTLSRALERLARKPMPFTLTKSAVEMFNVLGRHSSFGYKLIFANLWCFAPLLDWICRKSGGELNALVRTTCAFTRMKASEAYNVLPTSATAGLNLRLISGDTAQAVKARMERIIGDPSVTLTIRQGMEASKISDTYDDSWNRLDSAIRQTYPEALVTPYLMLAASDSRHYCQISDHVLRFSGMPLSKEQRGLIHNANERIPLDYLKNTIGFFARVLLMS